MTGFPWTQLVFCLACLSMAAWTWMRYSYAWDVKPSDLGEPYFHRYLRCTGYVGVVPKGPVALLDAPGDYSKGVNLGGHYDCPEHGIPCTLSGRYYDPGGLFRGLPHFHAGEGRFHPASVAGLVVGAMGVFIFVLYLRAWLRERKAAA